MSAKEGPEVPSERRLADGKSLREEKRRRWEAKQERLVKKQKTEEQWETWINNHPGCASLVTSQDVHRLKPAAVNDEDDADNDTSPISDLLRPYLDLQDGGALKTAQGSGGESLFIAEGTETIRILIQQSGQSEESSSSNMNAIRVKSIFVKPSVLFTPPVSLLVDVEKAAETRTVGNETPQGLPFHVLVGAEETLSSVAGFQISRGALACGVIPDRNETWLMDYLRKQKTDGGLRLLALDGISDTANLGSMIRCSSAFGVQAILLSRDCCDAWYRRSVRVSMGHVFRVPCVRVENLAATMQKLSLAPLGVTSYAAVIDMNADLILEGLERGSIPKSWCCVMGNEAVGISSQVAEACSHTIRIDMVRGVDSLSVPLATGILLHGLKEREQT